MSARNATPAARTPAARTQATHTQAPRTPRTVPGVRFPVGEPIVETPAPEPVIGADAAFVFEGGGMRGLFTAGVIDVLMEHGVTAGLVVGVSAGVTFGCNFKSLQIGRPRRYNERYCADHRYASLRNLITTGDLYSRDFAYGELPWTLDPFDLDAFRANPMRFFSVSTDLVTGEAVYHELDGTGDEIIEWIRSSASIPVLSRPVELDGRLLLDGGVADSIPVAWARAQGLSKTVAVLTQPAGYRKDPNSLMPLLRVWFRRYPRFAECLADRHLRYNETLDKIASLERAGELFVIRPSASVKTPGIVRDPAILEVVYQRGRADAEQALPELLSYLQG